MIFDAAKGLKAEDIAAEVSPICPGLSSDPVRAYMKGHLDRWA